MKKSDFDNFYNTIIKVIANQFVRSNPEYGFRDEPNPLYEEYINQKAFIRGVYQKNDSESLDEKDFLDRHKVCACMTSAIISLRLLYCSEIPSDEELSKAKINRLNEQLAFLSSWELLKAFIITRNSKNDVNFKNNVVFKLPDTYHNTSFVDTITRSLYYAHTLNGVNVPMLANIYYLIEKYCEKANDCKFV